MSSASIDRRPLPWLAAFLVFICLAAASGTAMAAGPPVATASVPLGFQGNSLLGDEELRTAAALELADFAAQGRRVTAIDDAAFQMELRYRRAGRPFASVGYDYDPEAARPEVLFRIDEGPAVTVRAVRLPGAEQVKAAALLSLYAMDGRYGPPALPGLPFVERTWDDLVGRIRDLYIGEGYLDSRVQAPAISFNQARIEAEVSIAIHEGPRYTLERLVILGDPPPNLRSDLDELAGQHQGKGYHPRLRSTIENRIVELLRNAGYAETSVTMEKEKEGGRVRLLATIVPGPLVSIAGIRVSGNQRTREGFIRKQLSLRPGDVFSAKAKQESFSRLYASGLFSTVRIGLAGPRAATRQDLLVEVEERSSRELSFEPGWGSYELLRFVGGYRERNLFGTGRGFRANVEASAKSRSLTLAFTDPWLFDGNLSLDAPLSYLHREEPSYTEEKIGMAFNFTTRLTRYSSFNFAYFLDSHKITDMEDDGAASGEEDNYRNAGGKIQLGRDTRDDVFFPSRGYKGNVSLELVDPLFGGEISYTRFMTGVAMFHALSPNTILGWRWNTGFILPVREGDVIPVNERFFNGGSGSVRSFDQSQLGPLDDSGDPLGGTASNVFGIELRRKFARHFSGTLFMDLGNVVPGTADHDGANPLLASPEEQRRLTFSHYFNELRPAIGAGIQYLLPIGPLRLDLAFNPDAREGETDHAIHFSIGMAF